METKLFKIEFQANAHIGSGDATFGVVDKIVQRDTISMFPVIHSSSLKGAIREFFEECGDKVKDENNEFNKATHNGNITLEKNFIETIFGGDKKKASYIFDTAYLLAMPLRSTNKPYFMASCPALINEYLNSNHISVGIEKPLIEIEKPLIVQNKKTQYENLQIEDYKEFDYAENEGLLRKLGLYELVIFPNDIFLEICEYLPVIARNCLENGQSKNLWYEEVVPRKSIFYFNLYIPKNGSNYDNFKKTIEYSTIQIGANATIGYGFSKISEVTK